MTDFKVGDMVKYLGITPGKVVAIRTKPSVILILERPDFNARWRVKAEECVKVDMNDPEQRKDILRRL